MTGMVQTPDEMQSASHAAQAVKAQIGVEAQAARTLAGSCRASLRQGLTGTQGEVPCLQVACLGKLYKFRRQTRPAGMALH